MTPDRITAKRKNIALGVSTAALVILGMVKSVSAGGGIRTVVLTGDALPGVPEDVVFSGSTVFHMNNRGQVLFRGHLSGPSLVGIRSGLWLDTPGTGLTYIVRDGQQAPGSLNGINFSTLDIPELNDAGQVQIRSFLSDSTGAMPISDSDRGTDNFGDWIWRPGVGITRLGVGEDPTPSLNHRFQPDGSPINNLGQQVRGAQISPAFGGPTDSLWLVEAEAQPRLIAERSAQAPGLASGIVFGPFGSANVRANVNNAGQIVFQSTLAGRGVDSTNDEAVWLDDGTGVVSLLAREGEPAPGLPMGVALDGVSISIADSGRVVMSASVRGPGINSTNDTVRWSGPSVDSLELFAREGDPAPGAGEGVLFDRGGGRSATNAHGHVAFPNTLRGTGVHSGNDLGFWSHVPGRELELIVRDGDPAPGGGPDAVFDLTFSPENPSFAGTLSLNDAGQLLLNTGMTGPGITAENDRGIWAQDRDGILQLIVREGQQLDVENGPGVDLRTIDNLGFTTPPTINNLGQVVFSAQFTDGSEGIFVSNLVAVPEPRSIALVVICGLTMLPPRWRRG